MATLTTAEILSDTLSAFKTMLPMLGAFSTDFSNARSRKGETIMAHVSTLPATTTYDATTGYANGAVEASSLLSDVPVALDQHGVVTVKVDYLDQLASRKDLYIEATRNNAYVLAKQVVDYALGLVSDANVTQESVVSTANTSLTSLENVRTAMNIRKAAPIGRFGICSSAFSGALLEDARIASRDYYGQLNGGSGFRRFVGVAGFENIWEYPDMPTNSINLAAVFGDRRGVVVASRLPNVNDGASAFNVPAIARFDTVTDPDSGLSLLGIAWQAPSTFDVFFTITLLYGASVGAQGGAAGAKTDYALHKIVTA